MDHKIDMYRIICDVEVCALALRVISREAGWKKVDTVKQLSARVTANSVDDVDRVFVKHTRQREAILESVRENGICIFVFSVYEDVARRPSVARESGHAVAVVLSRTGALIVDPNGFRARVGRRGRRRDDQGSRQGRFVSALQRVLGDAYTVEVAEDTPSLNFVPGTLQREVAAMRLPFPVDPARNGYCFVISLLIIFDCLCSGALFAAPNHVARTYRDIGGDPLSLFLFGRAFLSAVFRRLMAHLPLGKRPKWWPEKARYLDVRKYRNHVVERRGGGGFAVVEG